MYLKNQVTKIVLFALVFSSVSLSAQNMCDKMVNPQLEKIEASLNNLKTATRDAAFDSEMEKVEGMLKQTLNKIKNCEMRSRMSQDALKERLKALKNEHAVIGGGAPIVAQNKDIDFRRKSDFIRKMQGFIDSHDCMKEEDKNITRSDIEILNAYQDDDSDYYKSNIMRAKSALESLAKRLNREDWVAKAKIHIDNKVNPNKETQNKFMTCYLSDLNYIKSVAFPKNENLQTIITYIKKYM